MAFNVTVRVHYPLREGRLALRTDIDWEREDQPTAVVDGGNCCEFRLETDRPFLYFKPVLLNGGTQRWSVGGNYVSFAARAADVYPTFFDDSRCSVCELRELASPAGGAAYRYRIFYPPGYDENPLRHYPVLYMQDGQNLFFPDEAFGGEHWRVRETLEILDAMNVIGRVIVVGVYPNDRQRDYTRPGYEEYGRFLLEALKPRIDSDCRTLRGPEHTGVMGSSLGGVVSFYLAWQWPEVFGMAACMSSTFGWRDDLRERVLAEPKRSTKIYLDTGWPGDNYEVTRDMRSLLVSRGYQEGVDLLYLAFPKALHNERNWAMRSHIPFQFFFGDWSR